MSIPILSCPPFHIYCICASLSETRLSKTQQPSEQTAASKGTRYGVDAFFAKRVDDHRIDVHAEGQLMMREIMNPVNAGSKWDCNVNPQPTLHDLRTSIASCSQRNVRVLHLAGHGRKECSFIWNANDTAKKSKEFDVDAIALAVSMAAGARGALECAVFNACSTEKMGRLLRIHNAPYVICWKTPVQDETAKEFCELFYHALIKDASGKRDYKVAFLAATNSLRLSAHTSGTTEKPRGDEDDAVASDSLMHHGHTRSVNCHEARLEGSSRGRVKQEHEEDVVLFLSNDGDSDPIYLWRERLGLLPATLVDAVAEQPAGAEEPVNAALVALFEQRGLGALCGNVCKALGVECVDDLADIDKEMLEDLPKYMKDELKPVHKKRLLAMIGLSSTPDTALTGVSCVRISASAEPLLPTRGEGSQAAKAPRQQVFLGYRVASDADLVEQLHDKLKAEGVQVWWDRRCLPAGQPWEEGFADGLCNSDVFVPVLFVPVLSKAALANFTGLTAASACNNVLLEHQLALELKHHGHLRAIFPVLVGEIEHHSTLGALYGDFFEGSCMPMCQGDVTVEAVEGKVVEHLKRLGKGPLLLPGSARTVKATLAAITSN